MTWADTNYVYKKKITIDFTLVPANQVDYTMGIDVTDADLTDCLANGYDIKFYDSTESVQLKHEREKWDNTTGRLIAWVKIPSLSSIADTIIYMYYEYPAEVIDQSDASNTWNSYFEAVWHMNSVNDSTSNSWDLTNVGADLTVDGGKIGDCYHFIEANADHMTHATFLSVMPASYELTMELWVNHKSDPGADQNYISKTNITGEDRIHFRRTTSTDTLQIYAEGGNGGNDFATDGALNDDTWYHCAAIYNNGLALKVIRDGINITNGDVISTIRSGFDEAFYVGALSTDYGAPTPIRYTMDGYLDEIRIYNIDIGEDWIETDYNNQSDPSAFMEFGSEEDNFALCNCRTFTLTGSSYTIELTKPSPRGEDNKIIKDLKRFSFWSGNYAVHDDGIASQPLMLSGIEEPCGAKTAEFQKINEMMDNHEEITIAGLGDCMNAVYVIRNFSYKTLKNSDNAHSWTITLEKVRD